jgi:hypothetical protein
MSNCRDCTNFVSIDKQGNSERRCKKGLSTKYEDHECEKYVRWGMYCSDCS